MGRMDTLMPAENLPNLVADELAQAATDDRLIELWLHGRNTLTAAAYSADVGRFLGWVGLSPSAIFKIGLIR